MEFVNPFVLPIDNYKRDLDVMRHYVDQTASYLSIMTGDDYDTCRKFVNDTVRQKGTEYGIKDPKVVFMHREESGDRFQKSTNFSTYLSKAIRDDELIAPTLTIYTPPSKKKSLLVDYVDGNIKKRGVAKKAMFAAEMAGNELLRQIKYNEQINAKLSNNSLSGAHVSSSTPLFNKTAHSTLTSTCRSTSGYGNANNEKMLSGNRHYWSADIVKQNIISIIRATDYQALSAVMEKYGMSHPTVEETIQCIRYSSDLYWRGKSEHQNIERLVRRLTDIERSAFVYTGDLYHIMKINDGVVRKFITRLAARIDDIHPDPEGVWKVAPDDYRHLAVQICARYTKGVKMEDLKKSEDFGRVASTALNLMQTLLDYSDFVNTFFVTKNVPASMAHFPDSIRRAALTSDTDSTIFTVQDWVAWFYDGEVRFGDEPNALSATMIFLASQAITHILAMMSANFGVEKSRLFQIAMKNEFKFDVFVPTQVAKHYYALIGCQEGNLFGKYKMEIKGVHLKSSNVPRAVMQRSQDMMREISDTVVSGKKLSILKYLTDVADVEREVKRSVEQGSSDYFRLGQIKPMGSYKKGADESPFSHYLMWNEVFGPKYGMAPEPPYSAVKVSTELTSPAALNEWLLTMEDRELAARMQAWCQRNNRSRITTFLLPDVAIQMHGIPKEILGVIGAREIILDVTKSFYLILESLGFYVLNKHSTRLVSDYY